MRCLDVVKEDVRQVGAREGDVSDRNVRRIRGVDPLCEIPK